MDVVDFLKQLPQALVPEEAADTQCVLQFNTSKPTYATIKDGQCSVTEGSASDPDVTITMEDKDLIELLQGKLNGMTAFMTGQLQVEGDLMMAQQLQTIFDQSKLA